MKRRAPDLPIYAIFNEDDIAAFNCGWRTLILVRAGRRWVRVVDWTTLDVARIDAAEWTRLHPQKVEGYSRARVLKVMRARAATLEHKTATIKEAMKLIASPAKGTEQ